jgi:hypothetical protein
MTDTTAPTEDQIRECMLHLEALITVMKTKFTEEDILKFVHLVIQGHIKDGGFSEAYLQYAAHAQGLRRQWREEEMNPAQKIIVEGFSPRQKKI